MEALAGTKVPDRRAGREAATLVPCTGGSSARQQKLEVSSMRDEEHPHQCPYCDLRFLYASEIRDHVLHDHADHAEAFLDVEIHELP
jgi:hypothetical protein